MNNSSLFIIFSAKLFIIICILSRSYARKSIVIVGAGVGGLVTGSLLAQKGLQVTIIEKNLHCGGRMQSECKEGYRFDVGPSLLLLPSVYRKTFELIGKKISNYVEIKPVIPFYRCFFEEDNTFIDLTPNKEEFIQTIEALEPQSFAAYEKYMKIASSFLAFGLPAVIEEKWINAVYDEHFLPFLAACLSSFPLLSHHTILGNFFSNPKIKAMLSFQDLYIGLSPYEAPSVFSLLQALEFDEGIYYPTGGFQTIASALEQIARESQVDIKTNYTIKEILFDKDLADRASGVLVSDNMNSEESFEMFADIIVVNQDAPQAELTLLPDSKQDTRTVEGRPSCGVVSLSFGFNVELSPLLHHSIFFSKYYQDSWDVVAFPDSSSFDAERCNFYVHAPSRTDPTCCPQGHDAITVLVPVPPIRADGTKAYNVDDVRECVLNRLQNIPNMPSNIRSHIAVETMREPEKWREEFGLFRGSAFGLAHSLNQLSLLRPNVEHPKVKNLYRVGASTRPGNGVPLVMIGAHITSEFILKSS